MVKDWERSGVIRTKAKVLSTAMIIPLFTWTLVMVEVHYGIKIIVAFSGVLVLGFIWSRPSEVANEKVDATSEEPVAPEL